MRTTIALLAVIIFAGVMSFALVRAGEPQSVWLWCKMLSACESAQ